MDRVIEFRTSDEQLALFGPQDRYLKELERRFDIQAVARRDHLLLRGGQDGVLNAYTAALTLLERARKQGYLTDEDIDDIFMQVEGVDSPPFPGRRQERGNRPDNRRRRDTFPGSDRGDGYGEGRSGRSRFRSGGKSWEESRDRQRTLTAADAPPTQDFKPQTPGQLAYVDAIRNHDVVFVTGPAGTGKTFIATALAVEALNDARVRRIVLVRPAVEAGEKLGFLPGDFQAKINPYLRPIFDALGALLPFGVLKRYMERDIIEIAPLAYMRGRTLEHAFIILDEAQNTTPKQMLMFLTRFGRFSKVVVTGDLTQVDLPHADECGLVDALRKLRGTDGISFVELTDKDIVRHHIVQRIINAYERVESRKRMPLFREQDLPIVPPPPPAPIPADDEDDEDEIQPGLGDA